MTRFSISRPKIAATFCLLLTALLGATAAADDWPGWRGTYRDGLCRESGLLKQWPEEGPRLLWKNSELGEGFSGPAVVGSMLFTMGQRDGREWVFALDCANEGKILWAMPIGPIRHNGGGQPGPRSTPSIHRGKLYTLGINGDLVCIDALTGRGLWQRNLVAQFGGTIPQWGYSESVLVDGRWVLCTPGGTYATILALWRLNGEKVWTSPIGDQAAYSSIIKVSIGKVSQYVQFTANGVVGVQARGGKLLWRYDKPSNDKGINIATPIWYGQTIFASSGYGTGGGLVWPQKHEHGTFNPDEIYFTKNIKNHHGGMILRKGALYGCNDPGILTSIDYKSGSVNWSERGSGKCSLLYADGMLYARDEKGPISLIEATAEGFRLRGRFSPPKRGKRPAWPHPVISGGKMFIRDQGTMFCYDVREGSLDAIEEKPKKRSRR